MSIRVLLPLCLGAALVAQVLPPMDRDHEHQHPEDVRLPNGKLQRDEIIRADYEKSLEDSRQLAKLAEELKTDLEKNDPHVLSVQTLKRTEEIEKLAKKIHERLKHS